MKKYLFIYWLVLLLPLNLSAQEDIAGGTESKGQIEILHSDSIFIFQKQGKTITKLFGKVQLYQDSIYMKCDSAILLDREQVFAYDSVRIQQGDSLVSYANYLEYDGTTRKAYLEGDVVLINNTQQLFTDRLDYDLSTKVATYYYGATLVNDSTQLSSRRGYYYVDEEEAYFRDSVLVSDPDFYLKADTLKFNVATKVVVFLGPTLINSDSSDIYCERGFYDTDNDLAEFSQNAQYQKLDRQAKAERIRLINKEKLYVLEGAAQVKDSLRFAEADTIRYYEQSDESYLIGNASFKEAGKNRNIEGASKIYYNGEKDFFEFDGRAQLAQEAQILEADKALFDELSAFGIATGTVIWQDTAANIVINCDSARYQEETDYLKAMDGPMGRPELISILEGDSLFLAADTLVSRRMDLDLDILGTDSLSRDSLNADTSRIMSAAKDVRIFKSDFQGKCDSLVYNTTDSLFYLYHDPMLWADDSTQFKADTMIIQMANDEIDKVFLMGNAIIINQTDAGFFNQIKGKFITAYFKDGNLSRLKVRGNAETIYYAKDDNNGFLGVDQSICSELMVYFEENEVQRISFYGEPQSTLIPMPEADHDNLRLKGFEWLIDLRPKQRSDLFVSRLK